MVGICPDVGANDGLPAVGAQGVPSRHPPPAAMAGYIRRWRHGRCLGLATQTGDEWSPDIRDSIIMEADSSERDHPLS